MNVFEYIEEVPRAQMKRVLTVKRTTTSKYLFYLLARHYTIEFRKRPQFISYTKAEANQAKGLIEEVSLFGTGDLFVLEGFPLSFVEALNIPPTVMVLAEVDDGELDTPPYSYKTRRGIIKTLCSQLGFRAPLREMLQLDWAALRDYYEVECLIRKAVAAGWGVKEVEDSLSEVQTGNILLMLKRGDCLELLRLKERYSDTWFLRNLVKLVPQLVVYRSLVSMGQPTNAIADELGLSNYRLREFEEAAKAVSMDDLRVLGERILSLDRMSLKHPTLAADLMVLRSGISLRR